MFQLIMKRREENKIKLQEYLKLKDLESKLNNQGFTLNKVKKAKLKLLELELGL